MGYDKWIPVKKDAIGQFVYDEEKQGVFISNIYKNAIPKLGKADKA